MALYVAVILTSIEGIVALVVAWKGSARIAVSPVQPANCWPAGGEPALTVTIVPVGYSPPPLPLWTLRICVPSTPCAKKTVAKHE
jgi:hypothetical protein